jgi:predicted TIM-barrel fold metal-dependent hydrolase
LDANPAATINDAVAAMRDLYYDTTSATMPGTLRCLQEVADVSHIVWGTDMPFIHGKRLLEEIQHWEAYGGFNGQEREAIEHGNALRLLPRLAGRVS